MDLKVKIYTLLPGFLKASMTRLYIRIRAERERKLASALPVPESDSPPAPPELVYITGFPRSGTTMMKYYLGSHPGLVQTKFDPVGFFKAWEEAGQVDEILVDKSNHYIYSVENIFRACGNRVRLACVIRDPRDCLVSFQKYHENREVPRSQAFWKYWADMHDDFLSKVRSSACVDCIYIVRYEDLVRFPCAVKAHFLQWLGLEVNVDDLTDAYTIAHEGEGWHDSVHDHRKVGGFALEKWKQADPENLALQKLLSGWKTCPEAAELMQVFGYDGVTGKLAEHQLTGESFTVFAVADS
jgi:hypothetical protein